ncbi:putative FAD-binding dehydrogenase [Paenibacillus konkukensis]|uniref:FAD-binding dehydrogenase n=1 Tax=Paenibacillus konkukensis TaxID=2020716 RepID=A0ABY4RMP5_9BACL|nr:FAD-dependent oxidoreductase [Paenibacillus konkukensis]UQZ82694.1 putative FAD-binding dehydrogenase [Paenibacillus konkukensis]
MSESFDFDIIVAGAGVGGISAALAAARLQMKVLLLEQAGEVGGTGVFSSVSLICTFRDSQGRPITSGIHRELFPAAYTHYNEKLVPTYDEQELKAAYERLLASEPTLTLWTNCQVTQADRQDGRIVRLHIEGSRTAAVTAKVYLDATADGNLSALAGMEYQLGREGDGKLQSATATFKVSGIDCSLLKEPDIRQWQAIHSLRKELLPYYLDMKAAGRTGNPRQSITCFPYPDGKALLFNSTSVLDVDPTRPETVARGKEEGIRQAQELFETIRQHPAFHHAKLDYIAPKLGIREGRRIVGEYVLTAEDCLQSRRFDDMVAACAYALDIHSPDGGATRLESIPEPGYYHIPYRSLIPKGCANLLLSSRCISGTHEAHSSYRIMASVSAIGEAAGTAAALCVFQGLEDVREVNPAHIRFILQLRGQFIEGEVERTPMPASAAWAAEMKES